MLNFLVLKQKKSKVGKGLKVYKKNDKKNF